MTHDHLPIENTDPEPLPVDLPEEFTTWLDRAVSEAHTGLYPDTWVLSQQHTAWQQYRHNPTFIDTTDAKEWMQQRIRDGLAKREIFEFKNSPFETPSLIALLIGFALLTVIPMTYNRPDSLWPAVVALWCYTMALAMISRDTLYRCFGTFDKPLIPAGCVLAAQWATSSLLVAATAVGWINGITIGIVATLSWAAAILWALWRRHPDFRLADFRWAARRTLPETHAITATDIDRSYQKYGNQIDQWATKTMPMHRRLDAAAGFFVTHTTLPFSHRATIWGSYILTAQALFLGLAILTGMRIVVTFGS